MSKSSIVRVLDWKERDGFLSALGVPRCLHTTVLVIRSLFNCLGSWLISILFFLPFLKQIVYRERPTTAGLPGVEVTAPSGLSPQPEAVPR